MLDPKLLAQYQDQWVALNSDRSKIIEFSKDLKILTEKVKKLKKRDLIITYILPATSYYSPLCSR